MKIKLIDVGDGLPLLIMDINKKRRSEIRRILHQKSYLDFELIGFLSELKEEDAAKCVHCYVEGCLRYFNHNPISSLKSKFIAAGIVFDNPFIVLLKSN